MITGTVAHPDGVSPDSTRWYLAVSRESTGIARAEKLHISFALGGRISVLLKKAPFFNIRKKQQAVIQPDCVNYLLMLYLVRLPAT